ncbi:MAG: MBL fold metallo-hydrolase [Phycisphaerales bacterium]|nr:MBL fold metallo-hydrolase [Phycisphaerales bacterium]
MSFRAVIIGTGSALSRRAYGSSAVLLGQQSPVLIDCPDSVLRALHEGSARCGIQLDPLAIHDILLTHLHGDHANGLEAFGWLHWIARQQTPAPPPRIHTIASVAERLWERLAPSMDQGGSATMDDYFSINLCDPRSPTVVAGLQIEVRAAEHLIPCCGFRISHGGAMLGWSGDTRFDPAHIDWLSSADVIVHETTESRVHTPIACLNALTPELRRKIRLIHMEDDFDQAVTDMAALREGEVLEVPAAVRCSIG